MNPTIIFSGMAGSGKSSLARAISKKYGLKYICGGDILKEMAREERKRVKSLHPRLKDDEERKRGSSSNARLSDDEEGYKITGSDWWETPDGIKFLSERKSNPDFDKRLDAIMLEKAKQGGVAMTSWVLPWLGAPGIKLWVDVTQEVRAKRIAERDNIQYAKALELVKTRDKENIALYKKMYGFTLGRDLDVFDLVLDANVNGVEELVKEIVEFLETCGISAKR